ncbi:FAD binding domain-containing protein [Nocardioides sp.]|uniref:FAD binding domain-containing protein n=1 Tax=Nocardioides sp. TaxID=35761 RepID=UPI002632E4C0|nr:FAD binding domain-containing protein [Nocardioides sp.]
MDLAWVDSWRTPRDRTGLGLAAGERLVAGGTWLFSEPQPSVSGLVDLTALNWPAAEPLPDGGLRIAATCTIAQVQTAPWPTPIAALVRECADAFLMSFKIQGAATVGGNLCLALPAGAMISLFSGLGAEAVIWTPEGGERREPVADLVQGVLTTSLAPGEVLRAVEVAGPALADRYAMRRVSLTTYGRSAALVIARRTPTTVLLTVTASTPAPRVLDLGPDPTPEAVRAALETIQHWYDDVHGAPDWRRATTETLAVEAVAAVTTVTDVTTGTSKESR